MKYHIEITPQALEDLSQLDLPVAKRIVEKIEWLAEHFDEVQPETLTGSLAKLCKLRIGDWRVLYTAESEKRHITIHVIAHRRKVYKT